MSERASVAIRPATVDECVDIFCDAFADYPVMRYVVGDGPDYQDRLRLIHELWTMEPALQRQHMLAAVVDGVAVACATAYEPDELGSGYAPDTIPELVELTASTWRELGPEARSRYDHYATVARRVHDTNPTVYLDMLAVRSSHQGRGLARVLVDEVVAISKANAVSEGVSLTTENPVNVRLYQHLGFGLTGHERVTDDFDTWGFFRPDEAA